MYQVSDLFVSSTKSLSSIDKDGHLPSLVILDTWHIDGGILGLDTITFDYPWYDQF